MANSEIYDKLKWYEKLAVNIVKSAPVPRHVAFIMDGNRRFADKVNIKKETGIQFGYNSLNRIIEWTYVLGIKEITVYALSIENLKRSKVEVDFLWNLAEKEMQKIIDNIQYYLSFGVRYKFIGNMSFIPKNLQVLISKISLATKECNVGQVNVAVAYTSRDEISSTIKLLVNGVVNNEIDVHDIDESFFTKCLYTRESPEVDLMVRTSGERRLSDFLLWQSTSSKLIFLDTLWPEVTLWEILYQIIRYQRSVLWGRTSKNVREIGSNENQKLNNDRFSKNQLFLDKLTKQTEQNYLNLVSEQCT